MERRIFVDVETPNFANDRICGIALWVMEGRNVIHAINQKIDPEAPFDARFVALHGIDAKAVAFEPNFAEFWPHIEPLIDGALWVAHHALFDLSVIQRTLQAYHIESAVFPYICTLNHARRILPDLDRFTLPAICHHFGIELSHPHDPFNDLAACNAIYRSFESCAETAFKPIEIAFVLPQDLKDSKEGASLVLLIDELLGWIDGFLTEYRTDEGNMKIWLDPQKAYGIETLSWPKSPRLKPVTDHMRHILWEHSPLTRQSGILLKEWLYRLKRECTLQPCSLTSYRGFLIGLISHPTVTENLLHNIRSWLEQYRLPYEANRDLFLPIIPLLACGEPIADETQKALKTAWLQELERVDRLFEGLKSPKNGAER